MLFIFCFVGIVFEDTTKILFQFNYSQEENKQVRKKSGTKNVQKRKIKKSTVGT